MVSRLQKPILIVTLGYPGSGKTHFSERLAAKERMFHLSSDELRSRMYDSPSYTPDEHRTVFALRDFLANNILASGASVICDSNFNFRRHRALMRGIAKRRGAQFVIVWVRTHEETALKRIANRLRYTSRGRRHLHRPLDEEVFRRLQNEIEHPRKGEPVIVIDGHTPFSVQYQHYREQLRNISKHS